MRARPVVLVAVLLGLLAPALLLSFTRLVEPSAGRWVRLESFTPLAIPLYSVALVVLVVLLLWQRRAQAVVLALLAAAGLGLHVWWFSPMVLGANPPAAEGAETVTVMSANLYVGEADGIEVVQAAAQEDVDVLVVQEISESLLVTMDEAGLDTVFPHRVGEPGDSSDGTMVFSRQALSEPIRLNTTWDALLVSSGGLSVVAVHPHAPTDVSLWRQDHALIRATVLAEKPDLVIGDFNATPDHEPMRRLADDGYRSVTELANEGWQPTWPVNGVIDVAGVPMPHAVQIDHVLAGPDYAAIGTHTVDIAGTDHRALVAEVAAR